MRIAILGGGFTGLTAAYYLREKGHEVSLFEKEPVLGGLAVGFKGEGWDWPLERAYHHLFANDDNILNLARESGFDKIFFRTPHTDSLYLVNDDYRIFPVDSPQDFLRFPLLSWPDKIRAAAVLAFLKLSPPLKSYEQLTAKEFTRKFMGDRMWEVFFAELFRKKFGKYAEKILASFLWARITKRTKALGYMKGGFQTFVEHLEKVNTDRGVVIHKETTVNGIEKKGNIFELAFEKDSKTKVESFDAVISTLPTPILTRVGEKVLPHDYIERLKKIEFLHALVLIVETRQPILEKTYWLNVCTPDLPMMFVGQHTNFIDKSHYAGHYLAYVANYLPGYDPRLKMSDKEILNYYLPHLKTLNSQFSILNSYVFKAPFAQPIFDKEFLKNKPDFITPTKNFLIANLDMTYPYDRGTNYAVRLGKQVSQLL